MLLCVAWRLSEEDDAKGVAMAVEATTSRQSAAIDRNLQLSALESVLATLRLARERSSQVLEYCVPVVITRISMNLWGIIVKIVSE
jgi:hypothetical protein